jgi:hypothetical protein
MDADRLRDEIRDCPWLASVLAVVRDSGLPDAWVGAGVLRDLVWGRHFGTGFDPATVNDIDVVFYDPERLDRDRDEEATQALRGARPDLPWQARNQAAVHLWYATRFGGEPVPPLVSIVDAVGTWPETATAVAVRLDADGGIDVCAPLGLADLLGGVWRRNPRRASLAVSRARLARHDPARRWPGVRIVPPD